MDYNKKKIERLAKRIKTLEKENKILLKENAALTKKMKDSFADIEAERERLREAVRELILVKLKYREVIEEASHIKKDFSAQMKQTVKDFKKEYK